MKDKVDTIEQYNISKGGSWIILNCNLNRPMKDLTSIPISTTQILIFGGYFER